MCAMHRWKPAVSRSDMAMRGRPKCKDMNETNYTKNNVDER